MKIVFKLITDETEKGKISFVFRDLDEDKDKVKLKMFHFGSPKDLLDFFEKNNEQLKTKQI